MWAPLHMRKIFVGGLDYSTTDDSLKRHFGKFGEVVDAVVMKDPSTNRSRGFGFVTFMNAEHVDVVQKARPHKVDSRLVETKRAVPRVEGPNNIVTSSAIMHPEVTQTRIFVGGLPQDVKEEDLESYFSLYGRVTCVNVMYDKGSGRHRGFAFVDFNDYDPVDKVLLTKTHSIKGRLLDVKKAISKSDIGKIKSYMAGLGGREPENMPHSSVGFGNGPSSPVQFRRSKLPNGHVMVNANCNGFKPPSPYPRHQHPGRNLLMTETFSTHLNSGWQYSISGNAEVLRNTAGAASNGPTGAPPTLVCAFPSPLAPGCVIGSGHGGGKLSPAIDLELDSESSEDGDCAMETLAITDEAKGGTNTIAFFPPEARVLIVEPFYGGSHKQLITQLRMDESVIGLHNVALFTLPSKKWHWRARTSALYFSQKIPVNHKFEVLFSSSILNLCELVGLRPDLGLLKKVIYFHENQLVYPVQNQKDRDYQYGYNQIVSCVVADAVVFNSHYNMQSFLREIPRHLKTQPDHRANSATILETIRDKCQVLYFPIGVTHLTRSPKDALESLQIVWPHRWEHDKDPETFFQVLYSLVDANLNFRLIFLGESYAENPPVFAEARQRLANYISHWGYVESRESYWELLHSGDVVVSTAHHEFFGVAMLEAVGAGCFPVCPNRLVYPEIFPKECLYNTTQQLYKCLAQWCMRPQLVRSKKVNIDLNLFSWSNLKQHYANLLTH